MSEPFFEVSKCKHCGRGMLTGLALPLFCRECVGAGLAEDPTYCSKCNGAGSVSTGISEASSTLCDACDGTGIAKSVAY